MFLNSNRFLNLHSRRSTLLCLLKIILFINYNFYWFLFYYQVFCSRTFFFSSLLRLLFLFFLLLKFFLLDFLREIHSILFHFLSIFISFHFKKFLVRLFVLNWQIIPAFSCYFSKLNDTIIWVTFSNRLLLLFKEQQERWSWRFRFVTYRFYCLLFLLSFFLCQRFNRFLLKFCCDFY